MKSTKNKSKSTPKENKNVVFSLSDEQFQQLLVAINNSEEVRKEEKVIVKNERFSKFTSWFVRIAIGLMFFFTGLGMLAELTNNFSTYWKGDFTSGFAFVASCLVSLGITGCGISVFFEKDKNYIVGVASLFVAFVALAIAVMN